MWSWPCTCQVGHPPGSVQSGRSMGKPTGTACQMRRRPEGQRVLSRFLAGRDWAKPRPCPKKSHGVDCDWRAVANPFPSDGQLPGRPAQLLGLACPDTVGHQTGLGALGQRWKSDCRHRFWPRRGASLLNPRWHPGRCRQPASPEDGSRAAPPTRLRSTGGREWFRARHAGVPAPDGHPPAVGRTTCTRSALHGTMPHLKCALALVLYCP